MAAQLAPIPRDINGILIIPESEENLGLADEFWMHILSYIPIEQLDQVKLVNRYFYRICFDVHLYPTGELTPPLNLSHVKKITALIAKVLREDGRGTIRFCSPSVAISSSLSQAVPVRVNGQIVESYLRCNLNVSALSQRSGGVPRFSVDIDIPADAALVRELRAILKSLVEVVVDQADYGVIGGIRSQALLSQKAMCLSGSFNRNARSRKRQ